ncbi:hypothetical protein HGRIS_008520 [Hohenbuehelia grisea]|uniref:DNA (cytosine-5-)-methyltransferase n=1 Tax=Hohenbuehelia grisea TaxID=104357 RepID=A0ABR3J874_9AGAR
MSRMVKPGRASARRSTSSEPLDAPVTLNQKRAASGASPGRSPKKRKTSMVAVLCRKQTMSNVYLAPCNEIPELNLVIDGEDPFADDNSKPVRALDDFTFYDPNHAKELISLELLEKDDGLDRAMEASGFVSAYHANDEDAAQEDDLSDDEEAEPAHLGAILVYWIDYDDVSCPLWVETSEAWYVLGQPSQEYLPFFRPFYLKNRILQLVLCHIQKFPSVTYDALLDYLCTDVAGFVLDEQIQESDLLEAAKDFLTLAESIPDDDATEALIRHPAVRTLLRKIGQSAPQPRKRSSTVRQRRQSRPAARVRSKSHDNIDAAVMRPENQTRTHVTPAIACLAKDYVRESLEVVGTRDIPVDGNEKKKLSKSSIKRLKFLIRQADIANRRHTNLSDSDIKFEDDWVIEDGPFLHKAELYQKLYAVNDVVLMRMGKFGDNREPPPLPDIAVISDNDSISKYFWFAKIVSINADDCTVHVQWYEHSSATAMHELGHPQQLYLNDICSTEDMRFIIDKVEVYTDLSDASSPDDYFCHSVYCHDTGAYEDIDEERSSLAGASEPPDNCPVCLLKAQKLQEQDAQPIFASNPADSESVDGVSLRGNTYHIDDYVFVRQNSESSPGAARIAQIIEIDSHAARGKNGSWRPKLLVRWLGRIMDLRDVLPEEYMRDERHLFLTEQESYVSLEDVIRTCHVLRYLDSDPEACESYLRASPDHFYCRYQFPSLKVRRWSDRRKLKYEEVAQCGLCCTQLLHRQQSLKEFLLAMQRRPLRTLDLFGGVGAFALSMAEGAGKGLIHVSHAVEISPSAATTFQRNSPNTAVYNQCANTILRWCIKALANQPVDTPKQLYDDQLDVPRPLSPGDIDLITIGFPCQSHSGLNASKKADDPKSNLILTALSYVDFLRPDHVYFENVRGFLSFRLGARQLDKNRLEGGMKLGGVKLILRALSDMGYQCRYSLMQAAHYGTPQRRVRFFVQAAKRGLPLPAVAQPTHHVPLAVLARDALEIKLTIPYTLRNISLPDGVAPYNYVSIDDAISDLPRFDWEHPQPSSLSKEQAREDALRRAKVPAYQANGRRCGPPEKVPPYHHKPTTSYQSRCRARSTEDLQHFTLVLVPKTIERVLSIEMQPEADYRCLRADLKEYQAHAAQSAAGRGEFRPGLYGRLDKDKLFQTTVTNVTPTAKQSRVLHPYCKRMVTVRELARSQGFPDDFVFETLHPEGDVITLHRQIGNAVPWQIGMALGRELRDALFEKWLSAQREAISLEEDSDAGPDTD